MLCQRKLTLADPKKEQIINSKFIPKGQ
jgi:hypothetical protein